MHNLPGWRYVRDWQRAHLLSAVLPQTAHHALAFCLENASKSSGPTGTRTESALPALLLVDGVDPRSGKHVPMQDAEEELLLERGRIDRKSTRLNSSHSGESRMPSSA